MPVYEIRVVREYEDLMHVAAEDQDEARDAALNEFEIINAVVLDTSTVSIDGLDNTDLEEVHAPILVDGKWVDDYTPPPVRVEIEGQMGMFDDHI